MMSVEDKISAQIMSYPKALGLGGNEGMTGGINIDRVTEAIAAFEETLVTPDSRFDRWRRGDESALTADELKGYQIFKHSGCVACYNGPAVGGASYQKMGVFEPYQTDNPAEG